MISKFSHNFSSCFQFINNFKFIIIKKRNETDQNYVQHNAHSYVWKQAESNFFQDARFWRLQICMTPNLVSQQKPDVYASVSRNAILISFFSLLFYFVWHFVGEKNFLKILVYLRSTRVKSMNDDDHSNDDLNRKSKLETKRI